MRSFRFFCLTVLLLFFAAGCSEKVQVTGKVTLSDGSPVTNGQILFEKEGFVAWGEIQKDGTYRMGTIRPGDGIPQGEYGVYFNGVMKKNEQQEQKVTTRGMDGTRKTTSMNIAIPIPLLDKKYDSAKTSGLTCSVTKSTVLNVTVELR